VNGSKPFETIETCLGYKDAKSVSLIGQDPIEGNFAWHVQVKDKYDDIRDFWIDVLHPTRVLKAQYRGDVSLSRYSDSDLKDPLPNEITDIADILGFRWDYSRRSTKYNVSIDPLCWTLDGLHMEVGTAVRDDRKHREIGYWNGTGLSGLRPKEQAQPPPASRAELLALLDSEPASPAGFGAALWILTNSPDGADVQKAGDVITQSHAQSPEMERLVRDLDRMRPDCSTNLLPAIIDQNPDISVRGNACMVLAAYLKDVGENGKNKSATDEAEKYYERVIAEFGQVPGENGTVLAELAEPQLSELHRLSIGKVAPEIVSCDLYGNPMKLSDYRGKIVTLLFGDISNDASQAFNSLVDQMEGKPFVLLGINASDDHEKAKATAEKYGVKWSSFQDPREGPIRKSYHVGSEWRTIYVLDRKGVIRYRGLINPHEVAAAVDKLLKE
jgi:peroxiredoxin